ncbi:MAG TPA: permease-like cell division protein FtsX [Candidatus Dormibacteraeota bacterium]|nr:permease-like cell division protein FtsX [Candidatus Dormibacteraeota bacterium]
MGLWPFRYVVTLCSYSWRWQRRRMSTWLVTAAVLGVVLSVAAAVQLVVWLSERSLAGQLQSASEMQVFLADDATADQQAALRARLVVVPGVSNVAFRSKAEAAARATRDPQLAPLAGASQGNPFPASFVLRMHDPGVAPRVLQALAGDPAVDPKIPASYTAAQAQRLSSALGAMRFVAGALDAIALGVGAIVALALLRGEIRARKDELRVLTLVGVPKAVIRVPLLLQVLSLAVAGSALAAGSLLYIGRNVIPAMDASLPFLRLGDPTQAFGTLSVGTLAASCLALIPCALLVRLPR